MLSCMFFTGKKVLLLFSKQKLYEGENLRDFRELVERYHTRYAHFVSNFLPKIHKFSPFRMRIFTKIFVYLVPLFYRLDFLKRELPSLAQTAMSGAVVILRLPLLVLWLFLLIKPYPKMNYYSY